MQQLIAVVLIPCMSAVSAPAGKSETVAYACPETAHFLMQDVPAPLTPSQHARNRHLTDGHRDDRMPPEAKQEQAPKKLASKPAAKRAKGKSGKGKKSKRKGKRA